MKDAVAILIENDGCYLFVQRPPGDLFAGYWSPPTGKVEPDETQYQTVVREAMEELGIPVVPVKKVWESVTVQSNFILHWWTAIPLSLDISLNSDELSDYTWVEPSKLPVLGKVFESHVYFFKNLEKYLRG